MKRVRINAYVAPKLKDRLTELAKEIGCSFSELVEDALKERLIISQGGKK